MKKSKFLSVLLAITLMFSMLFTACGDDSKNNNVMWSNTDGISVYVDNVYKGKVLYDTMHSNLSSSNVTYSSVNTYGTTKTYTGKIYTFNQLMTAVKVNFSSIASTAQITYSVTGYTTSILKSQMIDTRYAFPSSTQVSPAFMEYTKSGSTYFKFMFGQLVANDQTNSVFMDFTSDGRLDISTSTPSQWGEIRAFKNSSATPISSGTTISMTTSDKLRFNIDNNDYLNNTKIYYNYGTGDVDDPTYDSTMYNVMAPKWCDPSQQGVNYPYYLQFSSAGTYTVKLYAFGYGKTDSEVYTFTVNVS